MIPKCQKDKKKSQWKNVNIEVRNRIEERMYLQINRNNKRPKTLNWIEWCANVGTIDI